MSVRLLGVLDVRLPLSWPGHIITHQPPNPHTNQQQANQPITYSKKRRRKKNKGGKGHSPRAGLQIWVGPPPEENQKNYNWATQI